MDHAQSPWSQATPIVFVVDDDLSIRESLTSLIDSAGWSSKTFASGEEFLSSAKTVAAPSCLVLDLALPDLDGLAVQRSIAAHGVDMPIIFISGYGDVPTVQAMKAGAVEFLTKPIGGEALLRAIQHAIECSCAAHDQEEELRELRRCHASLTTREREVMKLVVAGMLNKQVGSELGISEITVKAHRGQMMRKNEGCLSSSSGENGGKTTTSSGEDLRLATASTVLRGMIGVHLARKRLIRSPRALVTARRGVCASHK